MATKGRLAIDEAIALIRPRDTLACGLAIGQPVGLLEALGERTDLEDVVLYGGLFGRLFSFLGNPGVRVMSGFFGPFERAARAQGARIEYLAADFIGLEQLALRLRPRVVLAVTTTPDQDGWLSFGPHAGATYRAFLEAAEDPERLALAEVNPRLPRVDGLPELGGNRVHVSSVDAWVEHEADPLTLPADAPSPEEERIAEIVTELIEDEATLQFGIGALPNEIARLLAEDPRGGYGIHSEMISDGVMQLHQAGKVANRKGLYDGWTVATFALGTASLYPWLDDNPQVRMLPVSAVNDPALTSKLRRFVSVNGALAVDLLGQVAADHIDGRQHSGVGGHENFVVGARAATGGKSVLCLKATVTVGGQRLSTIVPRIPETATVTTPRHHVQYVVTEYGAAELSALGDKARAQALIGIAHPDFRDWLREATA